MLVSSSQAHPADWKSFVPVRGEPALLGDLPQVVPPGERHNRGGLAQAREGVDGDRALDLVTVLRVGVDDVPHVLVQASQLGRLERAEIGMPDPEPASPVGLGFFTQRFDLAPSELLRLDARRRLGEQQEVFLAGRRQVGKVWFPTCSGNCLGAHASPSASA